MQFYHKARDDIILRAILPVRVIYTGRVFRLQSENTAKPDEGYYF